MTSRVAPPLKTGAIVVFSLAFIAAFLHTSTPAQASPLQYTLPFEGQYTRTCGFGPYWPCGLSGWHYGTDYELSTPGVGGHPVKSAARGTAERCPYSSTAGWSVVVDHAGGYVTRYLHFQGEGLPNDGQIVARGQFIGHEGGTPNYIPHLHFEAREGASRICSSNNGTAVDPYGGADSPGTYSWKTNPPSTARDLDFSGDGYSDVLARQTNGDLCLFHGNGSGGWIAYSDPPCLDGLRIGTQWNVFDKLLRPGDFSGDGCHDILARKPNGELWMYLGNCAGSFRQDSTGQIGRAVGWGWQGFNWIIGPGDFNGDGFSDVLARNNAWELCLFPGDGDEGFIPYPDPPCLSGLRIGTGWNIFNSLVAPSDFADQGDECADILARESASPYYIRMYRGSCGVGTFFEDPQNGQQLTTAWSAYDWLLSVGDFSGDVCSDLLLWYGGSAYVRLRRGNCNSGFGTDTDIGSGWAVFDRLF